MLSKSPKSCDTFAVLPPGSKHCVVFGKNSDRPSQEVQEVVYFPKLEYPSGSKLKCTYIEVDQVPHTNSVILSKPSWMWGAEMGSNDQGVCIGNEAVWTRAKGPSDSIERLLGMDLLRLGLERSSSAVEAVKIIAELLETYGQGGNCSDTIDDFTYQNSFLIADASEVWVLETAKSLWVAEKITQGVRNISNELSIGTEFHLQSNNLKAKASEDNLYHPSDGAFNFKKVFGFGDDDDSEYDDRYSCGKRLLENYSKGGNFGENEMFKVLRDKPSGICMSSGSFVSTASQVSVIRQKGHNLPSVHWFTATPDPAKSVFKPFVFADRVEYPDEVVSPMPAANSGNISKFDRSHPLYALHDAVLKPGRSLSCHVNPQSMKELELTLIEKADKLSVEFNSKTLKEWTLFKEAVQEEIKLYQ